MTEIEQVEKAKRLFQKGIWWGQLPLPFWCAPEHFIAIGDHGAGKTTIIELLLRSVLPRIQPGSHKRALIFDAKGDIYPFLAGLNLGVPVKLLNPFDDRCYAWDMAADLTTFSAAIEIAAILFPQANEDKPFFPKAAQAVLAGLIDGLNHTTTFSAADFLDFQTLAAKLRTPPDSLSEHLRNSFSPATRSLLDAFPPSESVPEALKAALVTEFNRIIHGQCVYDQKTFAGVKLRSETNHILAQKPEGQERVRLNRFLLAEAYPSEISRTLRWTLRDIVLALRDQNALKAIIDRSPNAPQVYDVFLKGERQSTGDVAATIHTVMTRLTPVAAAWHGKPLVSLSNWCQDESILVLGSAPKHEAIIRDLNAAIFHHLSQVILDQPEARTIKPTPQTWVVIDELTFAGHLPNLKHILATSRSKGGCFVLGFQHIGPVKELYKESTSSIVAHCQNRAFLRTTDRDTQKFVSEDIGEYEAELPHMGYQSGVSNTYDPGLLGGHLTNYTTSSGVSVQYQRHTLPRVSPEEFRQNLYFPHERLNNGIRAYLFTPLLDRPVFVWIPPLFLQEMRVERPKEVPDRIPNDAQQLRLWNRDDLERLALSTAKSPSGRTVKDLPSRMDIT